MPANDIRGKQFSREFARLRRFPWAATDARPNLRKTIPAVLATMAYSTKAAQAFARILESEKDWEKRVIAMGRMEETLKTDFGLDMTTKDILLFRPALCAQLSDNRTSVTKAACELVTTLVRRYNGRQKLVKQTKFG